MNRSTLKIGAIGLVLAALTVSWPSRAAAQDLAVKNARVIVSASDPKDARLVATITNPGMYGSYIVSATSDAAERVELRDARKQNAVVKEVEVPAYGSLSLEAAGLHLRLVNPKRPLPVGTRIEVVLTNDAQAKIRVPAVVAAR